MYSKKIKDAVYDTMSQIGRKPTVIVVHPTIFNKLNEEVFGKDNTIINKSDLNFEYIGIKIIESLDLPEDDFVMYYQLQRTFNTKEK